MIPAGASVGQVGHLAIKSAGSRAMATDDGPIREGLVYRQDTIASNVVHQRVGRLYPDRLDLFHVKHQDDEDALPEFTIPLTGVQMSGIRDKTYDVKPPGTNLFKGYITGQMKEQQLV
jgi:hypothetical protein